MTKKELLNILKDVDDDVSVYVYCSYNSYSIKRIIKLDEFVVVDVGDVVNPELTDDSPMCA